mmetsp:Transcript_3635/g.10539  ORF Transcript_3635/g.10539 Transcript_3635/m.10539 type:complete len:88 (+) Transcript_3635:337-600(+)|eukprot:CAMPEP_0206135822 /NCGR_PEP_ID=MMETSP1473-20131121/1088_1 /ASSEMBLY_ACC=CAM_ASM_001109 /TAXON_ID=1461547 /ORGANISM="Stichococcus sp, Strain RCC1054" /LENGTH=87 /DNA_ID=CAMNT_0053527935 /DNA_START=287 /DNA_END=550 /DNA_ORIENTATION=-
MVTASDIEKALKQRLEASTVSVVDNSGGCGTAFTVAVVSTKFDGVKLLQRQRMVNTALRGELKDIHALSIKHCWTPEQERSNAAMSG